MLREKDSWTTREIQDLVEKEFGVEYSSWQIKRIIKSFGDGIHQTIAERLQDLKMPKRF